MPKQNRISILIDKWLRVNEDVSLEDLSEGDIPLMTDMVLDNPYGKPHIRGGMEEKNSSSTSTNIGKLIDVKSKNGTNYILAGMSESIQRSVGGAWTTIKSGLTASGDERGYFKHTAYGDDLVITNSLDAPFRLAGNDLTVTTDLELAKPNIDAVIMQVEKNVLADANLDFSSLYQYMMIYVTEIGERSNPSNPFMFIRDGVNLPVSTDADKGRLYLDNLPVPTDARITSKWLFRTEGWDGSSDTEGTIFYLLKKLDTEVIDYEDNIADEDLDFTEKIIYTRVPDKAQFAIQSNNRIFFGNIEVHQKSFIEPSVVAKKNGSDQTPTTIAYEDGWDVTDGESHLSTFSDVPYAGGGGGNGGLSSFEYYQYMYTYEDVNGFESEPSYGEVFKTNGGATGSYRDVVITWFGVGGMGANDFKNDPNIKFRNIYRTVGEVAPFTANDNPFYLVTKESVQHDEAPTGTHPDTLYDYFDDLADVAKDSGTGLGAQYVEAVKNGKSAICWSQADRPAYILAGNIRNIFRDDQDEITGLVDDGNGILIFKENGIVKLYHTGASQNWYIRKVWEEFGCDEPKSLKKAGNIIFFRHNNRPYAYVSGGTPQYIGFGKQTFLDTVTVRDVAVTDKWVVWMVELTSDTDLDFMVIYDTVVKTWYQFNLHENPTGFVLKTVMVKRYNDFWTKGNLYLGKLKIYEYDESSTTDDYTASPTAVTPKIQLPRVKLDGLTKFKLRDIVTSLQRVGAETINLSAITEDASYSDVAIPSGEGVIRLIGWGGKPSTGYFDLTLSDGLEQLDVVRVDVRPKRIGVGSV